jgi:hypothetical protein
VVVFIVVTNFAAVAALTFSSEYTSCCTYSSSSSSPSSSSSSSSLEDSTSSSRGFPGQYRPTWGARGVNFGGMVDGQLREFHQRIQSGLEYMLDGFIAKSRNLNFGLPLRLAKSTHHTMQYATILESCFSTCDSSYYTHILIAPQGHRQFQPPMESHPTFRVRTILCHCFLSL